MRTAGSAFFALLALLFGAVALPSAWVALNVAAEEGFVQLTSPLASNPEFTGALADALSEESISGVELPPEMAEAAQPVVRDVALGITQLPGFTGAWQETLGRSHDLTFTAEAQPPNDPAGRALFTLDVAPLVGLVSSEIGGQFGVDVPVPEQVPVAVGGTDRFDVVDRMETAAALWPVLALAAGVGAVIALALARRRSTTTALLGLGVSMIGAALWLAAGLAPVSVDRVAVGGAVADVFMVALVTRAATDFQEWCLAAVAAGILLTVAGTVGRLLSGSRR